MSDKKASQMRRETYAFSRAEMQWQFGDWTSLIKLQNECQPEQLSDQPRRAELALYIAAAHLQVGNIELAKRLIDQATQWGADRAQLHRMLISGAYNSLARVAIVGNQPRKSRQYFEDAVSVGMPCSDINLLVSARANHQREQVKQLRIATDPARHACHHKFPLPSLLQRLDNIAVGLYRDGVSFKLDQKPCFDGRDPFLSGKVMLGLAYHATEYPVSHPATSKRCFRLAVVSAQLNSQPLKTWGIYFYLKAILKLKDAGVLGVCFNGEQLNKLQERLDWRSFIDSESYSLTVKASHNFYGIGYAIAMMRHQMGWESSVHANHLLDVLHHHYLQCSGDSGFADETNGHGRYDRYSFLLIAEIAHYVKEAGQPLTKQLAKWLRRSCEVVLHNINIEGDGFSYGRSIGAYGDTSFMEILSAAADHDLLSPMEEKVAYAYSCKVSKKFIEFWWDNSKDMVDLWYKGRRTDSYRGTHRALGETLSLLHQHIYVHNLWEKRGHSEPISDGALEEWIAQRPRCLLTHFSESEYSRAMLSVRDGNRRFNLPLVSGHEYHAESVYLPIPYSPRLIQGVPGKSFSQLTPKITLSDGTVLMPITWYKDISFTSSSDGVEIAWVTSDMDEPEARLPSKNGAVAVLTSFEFKLGCLRRVDKFAPAESSFLLSIDMELALFSSDYKLEDETVFFEAGDVYKIRVRGYRVEEIISLDDQDYRSAEGALKTLVRLVRKVDGIQQPVDCEVEIYYRS